MTVVQEGATGIRVSWTPSTNATGYRIHYNSTGGHNDSQSVSGGSTDSFLLGDLQNGDTYTVYIESIFHILPSIPVEQQVRLSKYGHVLWFEKHIFSHCFVPVPPPGVVNVSVSSITASSISLSWSVASGSVASWEVVWRETDRGTERSSGSLTGTSYTIDQLESTTIYTVTVRATNVAGTTDSHPIFISTGICRSADNSLFTQC